MPDCFDTARLESMEILRPMLRTEHLSPASRHSLQHLSKLFPSPFLHLPDEPQPRYVIRNDGLQVHSAPDCFDSARRSTGSTDWAIYQPCGKFYYYPGTMRKEVVCWHDRAWYDWILVKNEAATEPIHTFGWVMAGSPIPNDSPFVGMSCDGMYGRAGIFGFCLLALSFVNRRPKLQLRLCVQGGLLILRWPISKTART